MRHSRFSCGGVVLHPSQIHVEDRLIVARHWQDYLKLNRQPTLIAPYPEPEQWVQNDEGRWIHVIEDDVFPEEHMKWEWNVRNMRYHDWNDRRDPRTDIGYVHAIHK